MRMYFDHKQATSPFSINFVLQYACSNHQQTCSWCPLFFPLKDPPSGTATVPQPIKIRDVTFQNRIFVPPLCQYSAENGHATPWHMAHNRWNRLSRLRPHVYQSNRCHSRRPHYT
ncbi:hypothetical protein K435DRAFT_233215 [Dendrothele bispora CBS 962.96]|uniref:Uncharacterized protein n=1 Tax=Dendrothele bispora (strain CBS 962.96) TaxID=1314807 RepID=A0A4S8LPW2_DENBC|nr:hypothetical protein K435DRAFT_233215 [Dendrothele bispora CBS 962.96]